MVQKKQKKNGKSDTSKKTKKHMWLSGRLHIEGRLNEEPRLQRKHEDENEAKQNKPNTRERRHDICKPNARRAQVCATCGQSTRRANQHEPACFGLSSPWSFPSRWGIPLHAVVQPWFFCNDPFCHEMFRPLFCRSAPFSLVLGCSRSLVGVDAESSEVVQETPHPLFFPDPLHSPRPPPFLRTSRTSAVSYPPCAPQTSHARSSFCVRSPRCSHFPS